MIIICLTMHISAACHPDNHKGRTHAILRTTFSGEDYRKIPHIKTQHINDLLFSVQRTVSSQAINCLLTDSI